MKKRILQYGFSLPVKVNQVTHLEIGLPRRLWQPCLQQSGPPAEPIVKIGQQVCWGEMIAQRSDGLAIHAAASGVVLEKTELKLPGGRTTTTIVIETDQQQPQQPLALKTPAAEQMTIEQSCQLLLNAGIVGMGGAGFPSALKITTSKNRQVQYLIINGSECEPQMGCDRFVIEEHTERMFAGIAHLQRLTNAENVMFALLRREKKAQQLIKEWRHKIRVPLTVCPLPNRYTMGSEKVLTEAIIGRQIPHRGLPIDVAAMVFNVSTCRAVADALDLQRPLTSRVISLGGAALDRPLNLTVRLGTTLSDIIEQLQLPQPQQVVAGGPMMGLPCNTTAIPVCKATTGFYMPKFSPPRQVYNCINCGDCLPVCPINLRPALLFRLLESKQDQQAVNNGLLSCINCGACSTVCPSALPLSHRFQVGKEQLRKKKETTNG